MKMKLYEYYNSEKRERRWYTNRDSRGVCYDIYKRGDALFFYRCDTFVCKSTSLIELENRIKSDWEE